MVLFQRTTFKFTVITTILFCGHLFAQLSESQPTQTAAYEIDKFEEELSGGSNVSGGLLVGFHLIGSSAKHDFNNLYVARPKEVEKLTISLTTMDGLYRADMDITFTDWTSVWSKVVIPSEQIASLSKYGPDELVAYVYTVKQDPRSKRKKTFHQIFPASWGKPVDSANFSGRFFVNSGRSVPRYRVNDETHRCKYTQAKLKTAFNKYCELSDAFKVGDNFMYVIAGIQKKYLVWRPE